MDIRDLVNFELDPWLVSLANSDSKAILATTCRQAGKTTLAALLAVQTFLTKPKSRTLVISPTLRRASLVQAKIQSFILSYCYKLNGLEEPEKFRFSQTAFEWLGNGSIIYFTPGLGYQIRGIMYDLVIMDEAARISDECWGSAIPCVHHNKEGLKGRFLALTTPWGKSGWFYKMWNQTNTKIEKWSIGASLCPRWKKEDLQMQKQVIGHRWFAQEFNCEFSDVLSDLPITEEY